MELTDCSTRTRSIVWWQSAGQREQRDGAVELRPATKKQTVPLMLQYSWCIAVHDTVFADDKSLHV